MPIWKWGPDNANLKLAAGKVDLTLSGSASVLFPLVAAAGQLALSGVAPVLDSFSEEDFDLPVIRLICKLIGADGFSDIDLPISSCQIYIQNDAADNIQVVIPDFSYAGVIADRAGGSLLVSKLSVGKNGHRLYEEIANIAITSIRTDEGAKNKSITLEAREDG
jgi:hypothetical protein